MKRSLLLFLFFCSSILGFSQSVSITGSSAGSSGNVVVGQNIYHASESIYLDAEIGASNFVGAGNGITRIEFACNNTSTATFPISVPGYSIYMQNVPSTTTTFTTGTYSLSGYTLVYSGSLNMTSNGGSQYSFTFSGGVDLTTPFVRTSGTNLQVLLIRNSGSSTPGLVFDCSNGNSSSGSANSSRRYNDVTVPAAGSTSLTVTAFRPAIKLIRSSANDAGVTTFTSLPSPSCFNSPQTISVTLSNVGTNTIAASAAPVTLAVAGANTFSSTVSNASSIAPGGSTTITFTGVNLNNVGTNNITVYSSLPGDGSAANDTLRTTITTTNVRTSFPAITGAEANPLIFEYVKVLNGSRQLWGLNSSFTTSATGAYKNLDLTDSIYPKSGTKFFLFDTYSGASSVGTRGVLFTGCFAFPATNGTNVYDMKFWMTQDNSYNTDLDSVYAVVSTDKGVTWNRILPGFGRVNSAFTTPGWIQRTVDLTAYAGQTIQLGIEGVSAYGNVIGIDDIAVRANSPLPVTFASFTGLKDGAKNVLQWSTTTELNNAFFSLERSLDGTNFNELTTVTSKAVNGNSNTILNYDFTDFKPIAGNNYYRLKQVDKDGKFSYSQVVLLKGNKANGISISAIYPNPAKDNVSIVFNTEFAAKVNIAIVDIAGKVVQQKQTSLSSGQTNYTTDISTLKAGNYIVKISDVNGVLIEVQKLNKQ